MTCTNLADMVINALGGQQYLPHKGDNPDLRPCGTLIDEMVTNQIPHVPCKQYPLVVTVMCSNCYHTWWLATYPGKEPHWEI